MHFTFTAAVFTALLAFASTSALAAPQSHRRAMYARDESVSVAAREILDARDIHL